MPSSPFHAPRARAAALRWLGLALETHIALPLFALVLLVAVWWAAASMIASERRDAQLGARAASEELIDTYEAQVARNLGGIDQTLKVLKYAVELKGADGALAALREHGLLPSGLVFVVSIADRDGRTIASSPDAAAIDVGGQRYFSVHRAHDSAQPFVSETLRDGARTEWHLHFTRRLNAPDGSFAGVAIVEVDPAYFTSGYERSRLGEHGALGLVGVDGVFRSLRVGAGAVLGARAQLPPRADGALVTNAWDGEARYTSARRLNGFPLAAVVGVAEREQMAPFAHQRMAILWAATVASAALVLVAAVVGAGSWQLAKTRRRVRRAQETYAAASEASIDAFFVMRSKRDASGAIVDFVIDGTNTRAEQMAGLAKHELRGKTLCTVLPAYRENGIFDDLVQVALYGGVHEAEWQGQTHAMDQRWMHRQVVAVDGGVVAIVRDITERKLAEARISHMAHHDELTGLPNRNLVRDRLDQALLQAGRKGRGVAVVFIDLDGFKLVNDGLGHSAGDALLKVVGTRMAACLRRADTLGRFGGDEFVIVLDDLADDPLAITPVLEKIRVAVTQPVQLGGQSVQVSCSMGVALYPRDGDEPNTLMVNADAAMYRAKELGSNNFQFYARAMNASVEDKLALLDGLRHALDAGQFALHYQPKVDLRTGRMYGVEALIRWQHPEHGMVAPQRFIALAEESGLIVPIGQWVLATACGQLRAWQDAGLSPLTMSVNVSPRQFEDAGLVADVASALRASGLAPALLELEVTESLIMRDLGAAVDKMAQLKAMGVALSIDDFGTGYSSLAALKSFPISTLKIDRSFVRDLADSADDQAIAAAVISLGHKLHLRVLAEGVETDQQRRFLLDNDCDDMQGYLFSRPVDADAIVHLMRAQAGLREKPGTLHAVNA
jgi:diguanylate cyclase (GGDEF)-like protein/PAS domain S-box-containing protein